MPDVILYPKTPGLTQSHMERILPEMQLIVSKCLGTNQKVRQNEKGDLVVHHSRLLDIIEQQVITTAYSPKLSHTAI